MREYNKTAASKVKGGYCEIFMASKKATANSIAALTGKAPPVPPKISPSTLSPEVQNVISFIFDKKNMEESMASQNIDLKQMPLGAL